MNEYTTYHTPPQPPSTVLSHFNNFVGRVPIGVSLGGTLFTFLFMPTMAVVAYAKVTNDAREEGRKETIAMIREMNPTMFGAPIQPQAASMYAQAPIQPVQQPVQQYAPQQPVYQPQPAPAYTAPPVQSTYQVVSSIDASKIEPTCFNKGGVTDYKITNTTNGAMIVLVTCQDKSRTFLNVTK